MVINRCVCHYRVEWMCTRVSRFVTSSATLNGETYVRYVYDRKNWNESKTLGRRLSTMFAQCDANEDCEQPCRDWTPPHSEWGIRCEGHPPHRILSGPF